MKYKLFILFYILKTTFINAKPCNLNLINDNNILNHIESQLAIEQIAFEAVQYRSNHNWKDRSSNGFTQKVFYNYIKSYLKLADEIIELSSYKNIPDRTKRQAFYAQYLLKYSWSYNHFQWLLQNEIIFSKSVDKVKLFNIPKEVKQLNEDYLSRFEKLEKICAEHEKTIKNEQNKKDEVAQNVSATIPNKKTFSTLGPITETITPTEDQGILLSEIKNPDVEEWSKYMNDTKINSDSKYKFLTEYLVPKKDGSTVSIQKILGKSFSELTLVRPELMEHLSTIQKLGPFTRTTLTKKHFSSTNGKLKIDPNSETALKTKHEFFNSITYLKNNYSLFIRIEEQAPKDIRININVSRFSFNVEKKKIEKIVNQVWPDGSVQIILVQNLVAGAPLVIPIGITTDNAEKAIKFIELILEKYSIKSTETPDILN